MAMMEGKKVVVTGAARGLGRALVKLLHDEGAHVALLGRNQETLEAAARQAGARARTYAVDVSDVASVTAVFARIGDAFGSLDLLVNNAALFETGTVDETAVEDLRYIVETNLLGTIYCSKLAIPLLRAAGKGDIISVSSESALYPAPMLAAYMASKAGIEAFTRGLSMELRTADIRASILRLGVLAGTAPPEKLERFIEYQVQEGTTWTLNRGMGYEAAARTVVHMANLPRDANAQVFELRSTSR